jgi:sodium/bile acid cotransporter 7
LAKLIFASSPALGLILLPVMLYHALQLVAGGILVNRMKQKPDEKNR